MSESLHARDSYRREPHGLPANWSWCWQDRVFDITGGAQPPASEFLDYAAPGSVRFVQIRDYYTYAHVTYAPDSPNLRRCDADDVLIARYGASLGRICRGIAGAYNVALVKATPSP